MPTAARTIRTHIDDLPGARPRLSSRDLDREARIVAAATSILARFGRANITFNDFAVGMRMAPATIRRHFADLDTLLADILYRHLAAIAAALGDAPAGDDPQAARRAAYVAATRSAFNAPLNAHLLLVRERYSLPADLAEPLEQLREQIGFMLAGAHGDTALSLLDTPDLLLPQIETMLAALVAPPVRFQMVSPTPAPASNANAVLPVPTPRRRQAKA